MRTCVLGMLAVFATGGVAAAIDPHVEGREPTPIAREFHEAEAPPARSDSAERPQRTGDEQVRGWVLQFLVGIRLVPPV